MSSINPNNINGSYPVAGQDNDSQGFRDNFTNIKNNFTFSKTEIEDLQAKAILKAPLAGTTLNNDLNNAQLIAAQLLKTTETINNLGSLSGAISVNWADGHFQLLTLSGASTVSFTGWPTSGFYTTLRLLITVSNVSHTLTLPAQVSIGLSDIQGASGQVITFPATGVYYYEFDTYDAGGTIVIKDLLRNHRSTANLNATGRITLSSSEDVANTANISLSTVASYFTTGNVEVSQLLDGTDGQIKTIMASNVALGNMTVTVTNAAWGGSGTITFSGNGQGCTLQYVNGKWFGIGNNGATFA